MKTTPFDDYAAGMTERIKAKYAAAGSMAVAAVLVQELWLIRERLEDLKDAKHELQHQVDILKGELAKLKKR